MRRRCAGMSRRLPEEARRSQVRVQVDPPEPGREAQADYGQMGRWTDPSTGWRHVVNVFATVLCCSRLLFIRPGHEMDQRAWTECHATALAEIIVHRRTPCRPTTTRPIPG
jgi:hypothetical protein